MVILILHYVLSNLFSSRINFWLYNYWWQRIGLWCNSDYLQSNFWTCKCYEHVDVVTNHFKIMSSFFLSGSLLVHPNMNVEPTCMFCDSFKLWPFFTLMLYDNTSWLMALVWNATAFYSLGVWLLANCTRKTRWVNNFGGVCV